MQARANSADGAVEGDRGIRIADLLEIAQHDHFPVTKRETQDCTPERIDLLRVREVVGRIRMHDPGPVHFALIGQRYQSPVPLEPAS